MKHGIYKLLGAAALSFFGFAAQAQDIKLGFNGDLSASPSALSGQAAVLGLQAAIDDVNGAGGVLGRKLTLVVRDDLSQPPKSIQNMSDLIDNEKVVTVFGPTNSGNALAWKQVPNQKKIPVSELSVQERPSLIPLVPAQTITCSAYRWSTVIRSRA